MWNQRMTGPIAWQMWNNTTIFNAHIRLDVLAEGQALVLSWLPVKKIWLI